jgi:hypothetical protein
MGMITHPPPPEPRFLVVVRAGRRSLHQRWLEETERLAFDLLIAAYEALEVPANRPEVRNVLIPGPKVKGIAELFRQCPEILKNYSHVALVDDDIDTAHVDLMRCFQMGVEHGFDVWQPSLTWNSHYSYAVFLNNPLYRIRYCNFIEMQTPFFSCEALARCLPLFELGYETGIDQLWCRLSPDPALKYGVVDAVAVQHTRPVGTTAKQQGFVGVYDDYFSSLHAKFGTRFWGPVVYGGILANGVRFKSRILTASLAIAVLPGLFATPVGRGFFVMRMLDHVRHNLTRPINNQPIVLPKS